MRTDFSVEEWKGGQGGSGGLSEVGGHGRR